MHSREPGSMAGLHVHDGERMRLMEWSLQVGSFGTFPLAWSCLISFVVCSWATFAVSSACLDFSICCSTSDMKLFHFSSLPCFSRLSCSFILKFSTESWTMNEACKLLTHVAKLAYYSCSGLFPTFSFSWVSWYASRYWLHNDTHVSQVYYYLPRVDTSNKIWIS